MLSCEHYEIFKNTFLTEQRQKQLLEVFYEKRYSWKFNKIHWKKNKQALSNSAPTPTHPHPPQLTPNHPHPPKIFFHPPPPTQNNASPSPTHLHPPKIMLHMPPPAPTRPHSLPTTQNNAPPTPLTPTCPK